MQFAAMLIMVRLLSPSVYGQMALAQTIIGFVAIASLKTVALYPLQSRDPDSFDWDAHFTAGAVLNSAAFVITILAGCIIPLIWSDTATVGAAVVFMSLTFILEIGGTFYGTWLSAHHQWRRQRLLLLAGTIAGAFFGILFAWMGFGVFALAAATLLFTVPLTVDFVFFAEQRPKFGLSKLSRYGQGVRFGINRATSALIVAGRGVAETSATAALFGFATLGSFSRAIGLAQITSGRVGPVVSDTLFAVLSRAEASSDRFNRFSAVLFQGVTWVSLPAAAFLAVESRDVVHLLYGARWDSVVPLLPLASAVLALRGIAATLYATMLANLQTEACLRIDVVGAASALAALFALPAGVHAYLVALVAREMLMLVTTGFVATRGRAITTAALIGLALPSLTATVLASLALIFLPAASNVSATPWYALALSLSAHASIFALTYLATLLLCAPRAVVAALEALPLSANMRRLIERFLSAVGVDQ